MAQRGRKLMVMDHDYEADAAELPTSAFTARPLSGLKCEVVFHHREASLQCLIILISFVYYPRKIFQEFLSICPPLLFFYLQMVQF
jgi:hypothetical protein